MKLKIGDYLKPSVYLLKKDNVVVYIGSSINGLYRALSHACVDPIKDFDEVELINCEANKLINLESELIIKYQPLYNSTIPSPDFITLNRFRQKYCRGQITDMTLPELKKKVKRAGITPKGSFNGKVYYRLKEIYEMVVGYADEKYRKRDGDI